jgi:hypothetical protein
MVTLKTNFSRDPDQERKTEILKYLGITADTVHYLRRSLIPDQLLMTMRVMAMNPTEVTRFHATIQDCEQKGDDEEDDEAREKRIENTKLAIKTTLSSELHFVGLRNEFAMLDLVDMLLRTKLQGIVEWDQKLSPPQNSAQEFIQIYRQGWLLIFTRVLGCIIKDDEKIVSKINFLFSYHLLVFQQARKRFWSLALSFVEACSLFCSKSLPPQSYPWSKLCLVEFQHKETERTLGNESNRQSFILLSDSRRQPYRRPDPCQT